MHIRAGDPGEQIGLSKNKERIITATHYPGSSVTLFLTLKSPIRLRMVY